MALDLLIPYWGDPAYMRETINSVLAQTNPEWLLTIVDDAYPSREIERYVEELSDSRIRYVRKESNQGITENFRSCVAMATQDVMAMVGCDDILMPNYVDVVLKAHEDFPEADFIQPSVQVIDEDGNITQTLVDSVKRRILTPSSDEILLLSGEPLAVSLMHGDWLYWPSLAFKTESIRSVDFDDRYAVIQDLAIIMELLFKGAKLALVPVTCFYYRRHSQSASSEKLVDGSRFEGEREFLSKAATQADSLGWAKVARAARFRATSRAHALVLVPKALKSRSARTFRVLMRHAFGP